MVTRFLLIRHAATDTGGRLCGSSDVLLSSAGQQQLDALLERAPRHAAPDALFTSTLSRAVAVAVVLERVWKLRSCAAGWAREIDCGNLEGVPFDQLRRELPDVWARNEAQADETFAWPGGESYARFRARVLGGMNAAARANTGRRVAVVTHAGVIAQVLGVIKGRPASVWSVDRPDPFTATEVTWENGAPGAVLTFNDRDWY